MENNKDSTKISVWDYMLVLLKWRKVIIANVLAIGIIVAIISFIVPCWYTSSVTILPPSKDKLSLGGASSLLGGLGALVGGGGGFSLPAFATPSDIYAAILQSRSVIEKIIEKHNLEEEFEIKGQELISQVSSLTSVKVLKNGMISLSFSAKSPEGAADIANDFIAILDSINQNINSSQAGNTRRFVGDRLEQTKKDLNAAEENLKNFQEKYGAIDIEQQLKAQISYTAELQSQLVMTEIELGVLSQSMSPENAVIRQLQSKIDQIKKQLVDIDKGSDDDETSFLTLPFSKAPKLGLEYVRLMRELKIQETIFELLTTQHETSKIEEEKDTPTIQILDKAKLPERRSSPLRFRMVLKGMIGSLIFSILALFVTEYFNKMKIHDPETYNKFYSVVSTLHSDCSSIAAKVFGKKPSNIKAEN
ncbi:MAG: hypothetical protein GY855_00605 [candidate division Zixibacteria bacterium]|nr:hypothetical protein [candidate division Zixibacteria bacterium]